MTTTLDLTPSERLRTTAAAVRISFQWFGIRRSIEDSKKDAMASAVQAESAMVSASKKILDNKNPALKKLSSIRQTIRAYWRGCTVPYVEDGVRLLRQDWLDAFNVRMTELQAELAAAVTELQAAYAGLQAEARTRLGNLFDGRDYPITMQGLFGVAWDYPSLEPPDYLLKLNPALYEAEKARIAAQFQQAVKLGEQAFATELSDMVKRMAESLEPGEDGKPKRFHASTVDKFGAFFQRFKDLSVSGNADLERLVGEAESLMKNVGVDTLRTDATLQQQVKAGLDVIGAKLGEMVVVTPRRKLVYEDAPKEQGAA